MKLANRVALILLSAAAIVSCAKQEEESFSQIEQTSLDAWMSTHYPQATRHNSGLYTLELQAPTDTTKVRVGDWLSLEYTGRNLQNDVFLTRSQTTAQQQGSYTPYTHYVPDFVLATDPNTTMIAGQYEAVMTMRQGQKLRLFMSSSLAYGSSGYSNNVGYGGQYSLGDNVPAMLDVEVLEVVRDPQAREMKQVIDYATSNWGMNAADSLYEGMYLDILTRNPIQSDTIGADSTVNVYYIGKFLDGFVFDTNVDSIQQQLYGEISDTTALEYVPSEQQMITAFYNAATKMRYNETARMVFVSAYGYGNQGRAASKGSSSSTSYMNNYYNYLMMNSLYGGSYYNNYGYDYGYNSYDSYYYNYLYSGLYGNNSSSSDDGDSSKIHTEILPYTPLIFEIRTERKPTKSTSTDKTE